MYALHTLETKYWGLIVAAAAAGASMPPLLSPWQAVGESRGRSELGSTTGGFPLTASGRDQDTSVEGEEEHESRVANAIWVREVENLSD